MHGTTTQPNGNRSYYWLVPAVFLVSLAAFYRMAYPLLNDNDVPWHLAIGHMLLVKQHLPRTDIWAYGNQDHPWFILSWIWDLFLGAIHQLFGDFGVLVFILAFGAGLTAGVTSRLLKLHIAIPAVLIASALTGLSMVDYITARPQMAGYALALAFHAMLHRSRADRGYTHLRWLPLLMVLWVNSHGSFMVGFVIIGSYALEAFATRNTQWLKRLCLIALACAASGMVNPYGPQILSAMMLSINSQAGPVIAEWKPFSFGASIGLSLWVFAAIVISNIRTAGVPLADKVLAIGCFAATMMSVRNGAFFILLGAPYFATCLDEQTRDLRKPQPASAALDFMRRQPLPRVWLACAVLFAVLVATAYRLPHEDKIESRDFSIKDAIDFAAAHYPDHHFFTDFNLGGQVIYHAAGKLSFFMDSRADTAYDRGAIQDGINIIRQEKGWEEALEKHHLNGIIIANIAPFATSYKNGLYHDRWQLVFEGQRANVYIANPNQKERK